MAHGGQRPGAGRKPSMQPKQKVVAAPKVKPSKALTVPAEPKADSFDFRNVMHLLPEIEEMSRRYSTKQRRTAENNPFRLPTYPPQVLAKLNALKLPTMAMDGALTDNLNFAGQGWLAGGEFDSLPGQGLVFLGFTYLAELAQRPEFRVMAETIADDATRKWIDFDVVGDEQKQREERDKDPQGYDERMADPDQRNKRVSDAGKLDKVKALKDDQLRLMVKDRFYDMSRGDGFFGRMHMFCDIRTTDSDDINNEELKSPIGDSRDETTRTKVPKGSFKGLRAIEPVWTYPLMYNAINPLREDWYNPQVWFVMGQEIHGTRLQTFIGHPVPDMLKPAYSFSGLSLTQMAKPYVDIWLQTRQSVAALIHSFSVMVLMTDMSTQMQPGNLGALLGRVAMFNMLRDNQGTFVVNKNTEDFKNVSASLSGLHELQAQSQEHMAAVHRIPLVKFTGIQPSGLNASSEGEIETYDDTIMAYQSRVLDPNLRKIINFQQWSLFGEIDPEITHRWEKLRDMTLAEKGQKEKDDADRNQKYVDMGAISPGEVRKAIIDDPELPYTGLDPDDVPEPPAEEGLLGPGAGGAAKVDAESADGVKDDKGGGADDAALPFGATDEWTEGDHPRAPDGKFGSGGGSTAKALDPATLKKQGGKLGSNEGGTFTDESGQKFYIKRPATKAHVENELAAARLYQLAGVQTLDYRPVKGGNHVATAWQNLDKKNIKDFTPAERKEAAKDFAVHAWLSNWDAAGLGGDNQGIIGGKPATLDVGGSLRYRAQGTPKGSHFGNAVTEIDTLRDKGMNPDAAGLFGKMTDSEIKTSIGRVTEIPDEAIRKAVGDDTALADQLIARKANMAQRFGLAQDEGKFEEGKHPRDPDGKFASGGGSGGGAGGGSVFKSKKDHAAHLLEKGVTTAEILKALNWPSISMPQMAKTLGMKLEKTKVDGVTVYKGTPMTDAEKAAAKEAAKKSPAAKVEEGFSGTTVKEFAAAYEKAKAANNSEYVANLIKYNPALAKEYFHQPEKMHVAPQATPEELKKAKKSTPVPISSSDPDVVGIIKDFNEAYAGKDNLTPAQLNQKVQDFKDAQAAITKINEAASAKQAEANKVAQEKQKVAQAAAAETLKAIAAENKAKTAGYMKDLGITEAEAIGFEALIGMMEKYGKAGGSADFVQKFKQYENMAKDIGYPISGFEYALLRSYINGAYSSVNEGLREKSVTLQNHVYAKMVNGALDKLPKYTGEVKRGTDLPPEIIAQYKPGHVVRHEAFTSTGVGFKFSGNVEYKIKSIGKRGADIRGANGGEAEVLFKSNTFFLVHKVEQKGATTHIEMEEVDHG